MSEKENTQTAAYNPGSYQALLVMAALASADLRAGFPDTVGAAYDQLDALSGDPEAFVPRAQLALQRCGFTQQMIATINWDNFTPDVLGALKTLRSELLIFNADDYGSGGCPCYSVFVQQAISLEQQGRNMVPSRKQNDSPVSSPVAPR